MPRGLRTYFSILAIGAGFALGYIFALDVTGWYFLKPFTLLLMEVAGAIALYRITIGMMEDETISTPVKRGFIWALFGLLLAHVLNLSYLYLKDLQASFSLQNVDFAETLAISWMYMHFTMIGFVLGALTEYGSQGMKKSRIRRKLHRAQRLEEIKKKQDISSEDGDSPQ